MDKGGEANAILHALLEYLPCGITLFGPDLEMIACNSKLRALLDFPDELFAHGLPSFATLLRYNANRGDYGPGDPEKIVAAGIERSLRMEPHVFERTRPNGMVLEVRGTPIPGGGFVTIYTDVTERKRAEERILHMANHDTLTDLPNRALFNDRLGQAISFAKRETGQFALLYLDLDRFKPVNDTLGHSAGDELLKSVAGRIRAQVRESDTVARLGGDEFAVILPDISDRQHVESVARKIVAALAAPFMLGAGARPVEIAASAGIALYPADARDHEALIRKADVAMYDAKLEGNCYRFSGQPGSAAENRPSGSTSKAGPGS
jgi:diguanylate cyclase (GGDEF)-like protein